MGGSQFGLRILFYLYVSEEKIRMARGVSYEKAERFRHRAWINFLSVLLWFFEIRDCMMYVFKFFRVSIFALFIYTFVNIFGNCLASFIC